MRELPVRVRVGSFLRSFAIQGSWNYRSMIGGGFAYALLPVLRHLYAGNPDALSRAVTRHAEHFNTHPHLAGIALGAVARMEAEGRDEEEIRRFKRAVRGPLGSLGDRLVWVTWLPACALTGLAAALLELGPLVAVVALVGMYNAGHLGLRLWGFHVGLREGGAVGGRLRKSRLAEIADRLAGPVACLAGIVGGVALVRGAGLTGVDPWLWGPGAAVTFFLGVRAGQSAWSLASYGLLVGVGVILVIGAIL